MNSKLNTRKLFAEKRHIAIWDKAKHLSYAWIGLGMLIALPFITYLKPYIGLLMVCGLFVFLTIILICVIFAFTLTFCDEYVMDYTALFSLYNRKEFTVSSYADYTFEGEDNTCATQIVTDGGKCVETFSEQSMARYETPYAAYQFESPLNQIITKSYLRKNDPFKYAWGAHAPLTLKISISWNGTVFYN